MGDYLEDLWLFSKNWCGLRNASLHLGQSTAEYLNDLRTNLPARMPLNMANENNYAMYHGITSGAEKRSFMSGIR